MLVGLRVLAIKIIPFSVCKWIIGDAVKLNFAAIISDRHASNDAIVQNVNIDFVRDANSI